MGSRGLIANRIEEGSGMMSGQRQRPSGAGKGISARKMHGRPHGQKDTSHWNPNPSGSVPCTKILPAPFSTFAKTNLFAVRNTWIRALRGHRCAVCADSRRFGVVRYSRGVKPGHWSHIMTCDCFGDTVYKRRRRRRCQIIV